MGMSYTDADGKVGREFFETFKDLEARKKEIETKGGKVDRILSVASVRHEPYVDKSRYTAHQGQREIARRLKRAQAVE